MTAGNFDFEGKAPMEAIMQAIIQKPVLQQQMDIQAEQNQRERVSTILQAVKTGQEIAGNMMDMAQKRDMNRGLKDLTSAVMSPEFKPVDNQTTTAQSSHVNDGAPMTVGTPQSSSLDAVNKAGAEFNMDRDKRITEALIRTNPVEAAKGIWDIRKEKVKDQTKTYAPQAHSVELANGQIIPAAFINGRFYYPNSDREIPTNEIVGKGYGLVPVTMGDGSIRMVSRATAKKLGSVSTQTGEVSDQKKGTVTSAQGLEKGDKELFVSQINQTKTDPEIRKYRELQTVARGLRSQIDAGNKVAIDRMGGIFQKILAGDSGNLAQWEQRDPSSRAIIERGLNAFKMFTEGTPIEEVKAEMLAAMDNIEQNNGNAIRSRYEEAADTTVELLPQMNRDYVLKAMGAKEYFGLKPSNPKNKTSTSLNVDMNAVDAELKKRGLLK